jgi:hypothetical protein
MGTLRQAQGGGDFTRRREGAKEERECFMIFAAREYPSRKNHETPFREEIEDIDLRRFAQMDCSYYSPFPEEPLRNFWLGYPRTKIPQHSLCELRVLLFELFSGLV